MKTIVRASSSALDALRAVVPGASNRTLRQMLEQGRVLCNGEVIRSASRQLAAGDRVEIRTRGRSEQKVRGLAIVHEDAHLLVVHKPPGLLTVATAGERERTAYAFLKDYLARSDPRRKLFIVHRLDRFASGLLVFAKSADVKAQLQGLFRRHHIERRYWAIVEGNVRQDRGTVRTRLAEDRARRMRSTADEDEGKPAVTHFEVLRRVGKVTSLEVRLETGRKNQIRVHLSEMGHPIVGDRAYGSTSDPLGRLGLHAFLLGFRHPVGAAPLEFRTAPPPEFRRYLPLAGE